MMNNRAIVFLLAAAGIATAFYYHGQMPAQVATHFDLNGAPNGWMTRDVLLYFSIGLHLLLAACFTLIPVRLMNFANKAHWLAPERAAQTQADIVKMYTQMGAVNQVFIILVMGLVYRANINGATKLDPMFWVIFLTFIAYVIFWSIQFKSRFAKIGLGSK